MEELTVSIVFPTIAICMYSRGVSDVGSNIRHTDAGILISADIMRMRRVMKLSFGHRFENYAAINE